MKILTGHAAHIALNGVVKFGGAAAKQKRTHQDVSFKSTTQKKMMMTTIKLKRWITRKKNALSARIQTT